jgi:hypothetical protein
MKVGYQSFERVEHFKNFVKTLTNQIRICEEIKSRLNSGNDCYLSMLNLLSSSLLPKNIKIKVYRTTIFLLCCMDVQRSLSY